MSAFDMLCELGQYCTLEMKLTGRGAKLKKDEKEQISAKPKAGKWII